jgi:hypothetical protein
MIVVLLHTIAFLGLYARFWYEYTKAIQNARTGHCEGSQEQA